MSLDCSLLAVVVSVVAVAVAVAVAALSARPVSRFGSGTGFDLGSLFGRLAGPHISSTSTFLIGTIAWTTSKLFGMWRVAVAPRLLSTCRVRDSDRVRTLAGTQFPINAAALPSRGGGGTNYSSSSSSSSGGGRRYALHAPTAILAITMAATIPRTVLSTTMEQQQQQRDASTEATAAHVKAEGGKGLSGEEECPTYGCPYLPRDVFYDGETKEALGIIRTMDREKVMQIMASGDVDSTTRDKLAVLSPLGNHEMATLTLIGYKGGSMESQINQDRAFCVDAYQFASMPTKNNRILGVFDGHAKLGEQVSQYAVSTLPAMLAGKLENIFKNDGDSDSDSDMDGATKDAHVKQALRDTFVKLDQQAPAEISGGCTASVVLQLGNKLYIANAGDSQSFIVTYRPSTKKTTVVYITREDKPDLPDERARVEAAGGSVYAPPRGTSRVIYTDPRTKMQSGLAMSRSIGDWEAGKVGVIADPLVDSIDIDSLVMKKTTSKECEVMDQEGNMVETCYERTPDGAPAEIDPDVYVFAISATDGLLDFSTPDVIAETIASSLCEKDGPHLLTAIEQLIYMAAQGWERAKQGRYRDDIAMSVAMIRRPPPAPKQ